MDANKKRSFTVDHMTRISLLAAIAAIIMLMSVPLPFAPDFLKVDLSEVAVVMGTVTMGPLSGVLILLIKNILQLPFSTTAGIGELFNFIVGIFYIVPFGILYFKIKGIKGFVSAAILSSVCMTLAACILNYYIFLPVYAGLYGINLEAYIDIFNEFNRDINSLWSLVLYTVSLFNIIKAGLISVVSLVLYIMLKPIINRFYM